MPVNPLYDTPSSDPVTPPFHPTEGYPVPPGFDAVESFVGAPTGYPDVRAAKRFRGIKSYDIAGVPQSVETIEGERFNDVRRLFYRLYQMYNRWVWLQHGFWQYIAAGADNADWLVDEEYTAIFGKLWGPVDAVNGPGDEQVTVSWTDESDVDLRHLTRDTDGVGPSSTQESDMIFDNGQALFGRAQVQDIHFQGESEGVHSAILDISHALQATRSDQVWFARENRLPTYPWTSLRYLTAVCKHAIESAGDKFPSFKAAYPEAYTSNFIDEQWWCDQMNNPAADPDCFEARCVDVTCPLYEKHVPFYPSDLTSFLWTRGRYSRQDSLLTPGFVLIGRENWEGLFLLLGLPVGHFAGLHRLLDRTHLGQGTILYETGETTDEGYTEFLSFSGQQQKHRDNSEEESDSGTILVELEGLNDRYDPAGGDDKTGTHLLVDATARTPGLIAARATNVRKSGACILNFGPEDVGSSYRYAGSMIDTAINLIQRVRPVTRNSLSVNLALSGVYTATRTRVTVLSSPTTVPGLADMYNVKFETIRMDDNQGPESKAVRGVTNDPGSPFIVTTAKIYSSAISGNLLTLEFELFDQSLTTYPDPGPGTDPDVSAPFDSGGYVVTSDIAHRLTNPGEGDGVDSPGDPERLHLFPGDCISFDVEDVLGIEIQCLAAEAFGGSTDGGATAPNALLDGIPDFIRNNHAKRDKAIFSLEGSNGALIEEWIDNLGGLEGRAVFIGFGGVRLSAVSPATINYLEASTGYAPVLSKTDKATGTTATVPTSEYVWDPVIGTAWIDASGWPPGEYILQIAHWIYDVRKDYPCSDVTAFRDMLFKVADTCVRELTPEVTSSDVGILINSNRPLIGFGPGHDFASSAGHPPDGPDDGPFVLSDFQHDEQFDNFTILRTYTAPAGGPPYTYGMHPPSGGVGNLSGTFEMPGLIVSAIGALARYASDDVAEARIELSFAEPTITHATATRVDGSTDLVVDTSLIDMDLGLIVLSKTSGTEYDLGAPGVNVPLTLSKITIDAVEYLRGTIDATAVVKFMLDNLTTVDIEYLFLITGVASLPAGALDIVDIARTFVDANNLDADEQNGVTSTWKIEFSGLEMGRWFIRTEKTALANGSNIPYSSAGLYVDMPDMTYEP